LFTPFAFHHHPRVGWRGLPGKSARPALPEQVQYAGSDAEEHTHEGDDPMVTLRAKRIGDSPMR
jgi:hypothetical protein